MRPLLLLFFLLLTFSFRFSATCEPINVLIIGNAEPDNMAELTNGLRQFPDFGNIQPIDWSDPPTNSALSSFDAFLVTKKYSPVANSVAWGDIIADFATNGGGVVCGFAHYDSGGPFVDYGRLALPENSPFPRGPRLTLGELGETLILGHPLMENVNALATNYRYDIAPNSNAVVVATFTDGLPLAGYLEVGHGRVVGIQAHFRLDPVLPNNGDFMQLYRNAIVFSVGRPRLLDVAVEGADVRVHWRGTGGSSYVLQATTNLLDAAAFVDISPPITLSGSGFVVTNYVDPDALTNYPSQFYRVRLN